MRDFRSMQVWHKAHALTLEVYRVSGEFPREEMFGLTSQVRRASSSIPANIAEGADEAAVGSLGVSCKSLWDRPANWNIICCWRQQKRCNSYQHLVISIQLSANALFFADC